MTTTSPRRTPDASAPSDPNGIGITVERVGTESDPDSVRFSVVVPTFNEHESIEETISTLYGTLPYDSEMFEVIVVDESTDTTPEVVQSLTYRNLRLVRFDENLGLARSVIEGFRVAKGEYLGVIDADGQHPPRKLVELFTAAREDDLDVAIASRHVEEGGIENWSAYRKLVSIGATWIARLLLVGRPSVSDPMSGFFVVRREVIDDVSLRPRGYKILLDILIRSNPGRVGEVGYVFTDREYGESNLDYVEYVNYLLHIVHLSWYRLMTRS